MAHTLARRAALVLLVAAVAGCGPRADEAQMAGQLAAAEAAAAKAVAAQQRAERAAASVTAAAPGAADDVVLEDDNYDPDSQIFDNTIVSPSAPGASPAG